MAYIMAKRGSQDNIVTYEHICDTTADINNINPLYITLGSTVIVLLGATGIEFYMANSNKEWKFLSSQSSNNYLEEIPQINEEDLNGLKRYFLNSIKMPWDLEENEFSDLINLENVQIIGYSAFNTFQCYYSFITYNNNYYKIAVNYNDEHVEKVEAIWFPSNLTDEQKLKAYICDLQLPCNLDDLYTNIPPILDALDEFIHIGSKTTEEYEFYYFNYKNYYGQIVVENTQMTVADMRIIPSMEEWTDLQKLEYYFCVLQAPSIQDLPIDAPYIFNIGENVTTINTTEYEDYIEILIKYNNNLYILSKSSYSEQYLMIKNQNTAYNPLIHEPNLVVAWTYDGTNWSNPYSPRENFIETYFPNMNTNELIVDPNDISNVVIFALLYDNNTEEPSYTLEFQGTGEIGDLLYKNIWNGEYLSNNNQIIHYYPFQSNYSQKISRLIIQNGITIIPELAFYGLYASYIYIPNTITYIGPSAFLMSGLYGGQNIIEFELGFDINSIYKQEYEPYAIESFNESRWLSQYMEEHPESVTLIGANVYITRPINGVDCFFLYYID